MGLSRKRMLPEAGRKTPAAIRNNVVFPTPLVPIRGRAAGFLQVERGVAQHAATLVGKLPLRSDATG